MSIKELLQEKTNIGEVTLRGWVRTFRSNRFIALNDGSTLSNLQVVVDFEHTPEETLKRITTGAAIEVKGKVVESQGKGQSIEVQATEVTILGDCNPDEYPIQPKKHSLEFLREQAHLRVRTNAFGAIMRVRSTLAYAIHKYFQEKGFFYVNTPIITGSDAEGAGEMFRVTTLDAKNPPLTETGEVDYKKDFFGRETNLTVSGQLEGETFAMSLGKIYTFGPTFRAENSNTSRHLAEFWMIEPEMAFYDLIDNMNLAEDFIKNVLKYTLEVRREDIEFLNQRFLEEEKTKPQQERSEMSLIEKLEFVIHNDFKRVSYTEAVEILKNCNHNKKKREERYEVLKQKIADLGMDEQTLWWYLELRKFGTAVHSGFGLGFERLVLFTTGMTNIRDVIPYPRTPQSAEF